MITGVLYMYSPGCVFSKTRCFVISEQEICLPNVLVEARMCFWEYGQLWSNNVQCYEGINAI